MEDPMEHERMRFKSMTIKQLYTRLNRITDPGKLQRFIIVAREHAYGALLIEATKRLNGLLFNQAWQFKPTKTKVEAPIILRRHLEF